MLSRCALCWFPLSWSASCCKCLCDDSHLCVAVMSPWMLLKPLWSSFASVCVLVACLCVHFYFLCSGFKCLCDDFSHFCFLKVVCVSIYLRFAFLRVYFDSLCPPFAYLGLFLISSWSLCVTVFVLCHSLVVTRPFTFLLWHLSWACNPSVDPEPQRRSLRSRFKWRKERKNRKLVLEWFLTRPCLCCAADDEMTWKMRDRQRKAEIWRDRRRRQRSETRGDAETIRRMLFLRHYSDTQTASTVSSSLLYYSSSLSSFLSIIHPLSFLSLSLVFISPSLSRSVVQTLRQMSHKIFAIKTQREILWVWECVCVCVCVCVLQAVHVCVQIFEVCQVY